MIDKEKMLMSLTLLPAVWEGEMGLSGKADIDMKELHIYIRICDVCKWWWGEKQNKTKPANGHISLHPPFCSWTP